ncbi:keratin-associated protein 9-1-like [Neopsephotus bourkii]|uniref:keratin-associated protein 9-1-like n=1 Tax=Neopsephotus bourkii TaxID=309878 RepID=UPI002AA58506|nr:keratin-associated protein 9-1-like [Neopsephotus bourkii]
MSSQKGCHLTKIYLSTPATVVKGIPFRAVKSFVNGISNLANTPLVAPYLYSYRSDGNPQSNSTYFNRGNIDVTQNPKCMDPCCGEVTKCTTSCADPSCCKGIKGITKCEDSCSEEVSKDNTVYLNLGNIDVSQTPRCADPCSEEATMCTTSCVDPSCCEGIKGIATCEDSCCEGVTKGTIIYLNPGDLDVMQNPRCEDLCSEEVTKCTTIYLNLGNIDRTQCAFPYCVEVIRYSNACGDQCFWKVTEGSSRCEDLFCEDVTKGDTIYLNLGNIDGSQTPRCADTCHKEVTKCNTIFLNVGNICLTPTSQCMDWCCEEVTKGNTIYVNLGSIDNMDLTQNPRCMGICCGGETKGNTIYLNLGNICVTPTLKSTDQCSEKVTKGNTIFLNLGNTDVSQNPRRTDQCCGGVTNGNTIFLNLGNIGV